MTAAASTFAAVAVCLYAAHHLADHVFGQTDAQAAHKADPGWEGWRHLLGHVSAYHIVVITMLAITIAALDLPTTPVGLASGLTVSVITHTILDRRWPVRRLLTWTGSAQFADRQSPICGMYLADQSLHHGCLWIAALLIACL